MNLSPSQPGKCVLNLFVTTFLPSVFFATGKRPEELIDEVEKVRPESRPESLEDAVLDLLKNGSLSKSELSQGSGHKHISGALKKVLASLLKQGRIVYTNPDKPNSSYKNINYLND
jgi:hypothetical protein